MVVIVSSFAKMMDALSCFTTIDLHSAEQATSELALGYSFTFCILASYK